MTKTAKIYADALYDLAQETNAAEDYAPEVHMVAALLQENPEFLRLLADPSLPKQERVQLLDGCFGGKIQPYLLNFLKILCERGIIREYAGCAREFAVRYHADFGILEVTAWTAVPMDAPQREALARRLAEVTGKRIELRCRIDARLLGGVRLEYDGKMVDGTALGRLQGIRKELLALSFE